jgi:hypothetical protein
MGILELEQYFPTPHFSFREADSWLGKEVYIKHIKQIGLVEEMKYTDEGYDLLIFLNGFSLLLSKPNFAKWVELKPKQIQLPILH